MRSSSRWLEGWPQGWAQTTRGVEELGVGPDAVAIWGLFLLEVKYSRAFDFSSPHQKLSEKRGVFLAHLISCWPIILPDLATFDSGKHHLKIINRLAGFSL